MLKTFLYWTVMLIAALGVGPAAGALIGRLHATDGAGHVTPLTSASPMLGLGAGIAALAIAIVVAFIAGKLLGTRAAMTVAGLVVAWVAVRSGMPDDLVRRAQGASVVWPMAIEGLIFGALGVAGAWVVLKSGERAQDEEPLISKDGLRALGGAALAAVPIAGVIVYLVAFETLKLQTIFAASFAGIGAGAAAALVCTAIGPAGSSTSRATVAAFIGMAVLATAGPASAMAVNSRPGSLLASAYSGGYFPLAAPGVFDWIAGAFLGVPIGVGWAGSTLEKRGK